MGTLTTRIGLHSGVRTVLLTAACIGVLSAASQAAIAAEASTPLEVFGRLPTLEDVIISPDGTKLAFVRTREDKRTLMVGLLQGSESLGGVRVGDTKLRGVEWIDDDNLLATISSTSLPPFGYLGDKSEWYQLVLYNVSKRHVGPLSFDVDNEKTFNVVVGDTAVRDVGGKPVLYAPGYYVTDQTLPGMFTFSIPERRARLIAKGPEPDTDWLIDEAGRIAAEFVYHDKTKLWEIKARKEDRLTLVASGTAAVDTPRVLGFSADGTAIIVHFFENGDSVWKPLYIKDGTWGPPLEKGAAFVSGIEDRKSGRIIGGIRELGDNQYIFFDNELQAHWNAVLRAFPNERVELESHSDDFSKVIVKVFGAKDGYVYALYDWYGHLATILGSVYEGLAAPAPVKAISYAAADGLSIPGFLTLPRGGADKGLPLIVLPHGGPTAADTLDFDWWAQALASQGYAVLQPNYRGSALNLKFIEAGFGQWGRKMQTDLSDGVRYLAKQGVIDPARVCIVGASYGGYAALAGVTLDPGVYRCAISVAGISDLRRFRKWTLEYHLGLSQRNWDRYMGTSNQNDASLIGVSPIEHVSAVTVPVLLIHGRDDTVVPFEQSDVMLSALKRAGKSVQLVTMKHEDHWLSRSDTRLQMLRASVEFLKANNPPNLAAAVP
jgi:dipeptidyl aminopeptidase/acylaminoacyl peptidase